LQEGIKMSHARAERSTSTSKLVVGFVFINTTRGSAGAALPQ
jgi:hypothetical protein